MPFDKLRDRGGGRGMPFLRPVGSKRAELERDKPFDMLRDRSGTAVGVTVAEPVEAR